MRINDGRYFVVGADLQKFGRELITRANVHGNGFPVAAQAQATLLQHDVDLVAIGRRPGIDLDHENLKNNGLNSLKALWGMRK